MSKADELYSDQEFITNKPKVRKMNNLLTKLSDIRVLFLSDEWNPDMEVAGETGSGR